jgi:hypothetical protein
VPFRPLVFLSGLTAGDYLLWNWSLNANHDVLALVSGLTLPPLALAVLWLLAVAVARVIAGTASPAARAERRQRRLRRRHPPAVPGVALEDSPKTTATAGSASSKLAA